MTDREIDYCVLKCSAMQQASVARASADAAAYWATTKHNSRRCLLRAQVAAIEVQLIVCGAIRMLAR